MTLFERIFLSKETKKKLNEKFQTGVKYEISGGRIIVPVDNKDTYVSKGYSINDIVYSIVNIILDKVRLPEWGLYKVADEGSLKEYRSLLNRRDISIKDYKKALKLKETALEEITNFDVQTGKLNELLKYPNETDTIGDLIASGCGYKLVTGDTYIFGNQIEAGANQGIPDSLELLPSQYMLIKTGVTFPAKAESYYLNVFNQDFTKEQILHNKYWNPNWSVNGSQLYGLSPLKAALMNLTRNNSAKTASTYKYQNNGIEAIIFPDDQRWTPEQGLEQSAAIKAKLNSPEYRGEYNYGKMAASGIKMGAVNLGLSPVELAIIDSEKWDAMMFCAVYGVPPELLGIVQKTYNNVVESEKALTTRSALPLLTSIRNSLNQKIQTDWGFKGKDVYIDFEPECFTELESNISKVTEWTKSVISISPNEERELVGLETIDDPIMDEQWVLQGTGRVPISEFQTALVDQTLNNDTAGNQSGGNAGLSGNGKGTELLAGTKATNGIAKIINYKA